MRMPSFGKGRLGMSPLGRARSWRPSLDRLRAWIAEFDAKTELPVPSPWAIAVAVLGLLAFGVFVGSAIRPAQQGVTTLLAASPKAEAGASAGTPSTAKPPRVAAEAIPQASEAGAEETSSAQEGPQATKAPMSKAGKSKEAGAGSGSGEGGPSGAGTGLPQVKHVFLVVLSDEGSSAAFGASSQAPYLAKTLRRQGELLSNYYAVTSGELANEVALISGQGPNSQTAANCPSYADVAPGTAAAEGQALGSGCVFPPSTLTLASQLEARHETWRAYVEGVGDSAAGQPPSCRHPVAGTADPNHVPGAEDGYVTWRNPFVYFHSLTDGQACTANDVGLDRLVADLKSAATTPSLAYIAPDRCEDGSPEPCAQGKPAGLAPADAFLRKVVPEIESSPAYKEGGLIAVTFDQAPQSGPQADTSGCCVDGPFPNLMPTPGNSAASGAPGSASGAPGSASGAPGSASSAPTDSIPASSAGSGATGSAEQAASPSTETTGGGKVGLLLISKYVKPGSLNAIGDYNHFSLLRSIEDLFGLEPLGYAGATGLLAFDKSVYNGKG